MPKEIEFDLELILKTGLDISPDCFGILNQGDVVVYCNNTFASIFGITKEETVGKTNKELLKLAWLSKKGIIIDTDDFEHWYEKVENLHGTKDLNQFESDLTDGRWFKITRMNLDNDFILFFGVDITDLKKTQASLENANQQIEILANTDQLTSVHNRRSFNLLAEQEFQRSNRHKHSLSLLLMDLDSFKKVNDNYGHEVGDFVLKAFAQLCKEALRRSDSLSRIGGEEFTILLPMTNWEGARQLAEQIRTKVAAHDFYIESVNCHLNISVSIGVSSLTDKKQSVKDLLVQADNALYTAKENGRNQVVVFPSSSFKLSSNKL